MSARSLEELLDAEIGSLAGVTKGQSRWSDRVAYAVDGREFVHFHGEAELDIRLTRPVQSRFRDELRRDSRVGFRRNTSEWITFATRTPNDAETVIEWIRRAWEANRKETASGTTPSSPSLPSTGPAGRSR